MSVERLQVWLTLLVSVLTLAVLIEQHKLNRHQLRRHRR